MPAKLDACVKDVMALGHSEESAYAICNAAMKVLVADVNYDAAPSPALKADGASVHVERATAAAERAAAYAEAVASHAIDAIAALVASRKASGRTLTPRRVSADLPIYISKVLCVKEVDQQGDWITRAGAVKVKALLDDDINAGVD